MIILVIVGLNSISYNKILNNSVNAIVDMVGRLDCSKSLPVIELYFITGKNCCIATLDYQNVSLDFGFSIPSFKIKQGGL